MRTVVIIDTSIFLNIINVPRRNQDRASVLETIGGYYKDYLTSLLLPYAAIVETGNHIAGIPDGNQRRKYAAIFAKEVKAAVEGEAPWQPTQAQTKEQLLEWLDEFPESAMRGIGLGDLAIVKEWEIACRRNRRARVLIWSLDHHLAGYDRSP